MCRSGLNKCPDYHKSLGQELLSYKPLNLNDLVLAVKGNMFRYVFRDSKGPRLELPSGHNTP